MKSNNYETYTARYNWFCEIYEQGRGKAGKYEAETMIKKEWNENERQKI